MVTNSLPAAASEEQLWSAYARCQDARLREQLVERYRRLAYAALQQLHCLGNADVEDVVEAMAMEDTCHPSSFDQVPPGVEEDRSALSEEFLGAEDPELARVEERIGWRQVLNHLDPRLREVIELRFYQNLSQEKAAGRLGVSQMQVSRLERRALDRLRCQVAAS